MHVGFRIVMEDETYIDSHDEMWNEVRDHVHALPPFNNKKWLEYQVRTDEGKFIAVNFQTGVFSLNGQIVHPATDEGYVLSNKKEIQNFESVPEPWNFLNGMPYFPVVGRRTWKGEFFDARSFFCGWKRIGEDGKLYTKVCHFFGDNLRLMEGRGEVLAPGSILMT